MIKRTPWEPMFEMANMRGTNVNIDKIMFSFFFSPKDGSRHGIRVKIIWNREKMGTLKSYALRLHGAYDFVDQVAVDKVASRGAQEEARKFFRKHKVILAAVWERALDADYAAKYFEGGQTIEDLLPVFNFSSAKINELEGTFYALRDSESYRRASSKEVQDQTILETAVRRLNLFNMND